MSTDTASTTSNAASACDHSGLFFELETVAGNAPEALLATVKAAIADAGGKFSHAAFVRYALHGRPEAMAPHLLQACGAKGDASAFAAKIRDGVASKVLAQASMPSGLSKLIHAAEAKGMAIGALTALPDDASAALMAKLGLDPEKVKLISVRQDDDKTFPRADLWLKLARQSSRPTRACVVVATSKPSCKSALAAGLRCIVIPHPLCAHEDVSGADLVLDTWDEMSANEILETVVPPKSV